MRGESEGSSLGNLFSYGEGGEAAQSDAQQVDAVKSLDARR
jgi:hypothetical protein